MNRPLSRQRGFSIVTAIFLLVVLAGLGAYMISISGVQRTTTTFAVQGARAHQGARSGIEWAIHRALNGGLPVACTTSPPILCPPHTSDTFGFAAPGLDGFNVSICWCHTRLQERNECFYVFSIESQATHASFGDPDYVSRTLRATVTDHASPIAPACP